MSDISAKNAFKLKVNSTYAFNKISLLISTRELKPLLKNFNVNGNEG